jgi:hypothetical protein
LQPGTGTVALADGRTLAYAECGVLDRWPEIGAWLAGG